ncbi:claudin-23 [Hyperolius riggenbachi]|uniref:claudin-23 n=1 Tax=Hyperolius riggenbachi TaxID=752182 RepID=UPI0035A349C9
MRTPTVMIIGMVLAPCGLVLDLTSTVAPAWRILTGLNLKPSDVENHQGLWDICQVSSGSANTNQNQLCGQSDTAYFSTQVVQVARGMMIASLVVTAVGIALASWGVRCWEEMPHFIIAGIGGIVIFISGLLCLIPISYYNYNMYSLVTTDSTATAIYVGYCLVLGYLGSCMEIIGGFSLMLSFVPPCKKCIKNKGKSTSSMYYSNKQTSDKNGNAGKVYSIQSDYKKDRYPNDVGYSIHNDNYHHYQPESGDRRAKSVISNPRSYTNSRSYTNPMDVTAGEHPKNYSRPGSQLSSLPCDSDLL